MSIQNYVYENRKPIEYIYLLLLAGRTHLCACEWEAIDIYPRNGVYYDLEDIETAKVKANEWLENDLKEREKWNS